MTYYGPDRWLWPIELTSTNNVLRVYNVATALTVSVTIPAGTYWQSVDLPFTGNTLPVAIANAMTTALGRTITYAFVTPSGQTSTILTNSAVRYIDAGAGYRFQFADAGFTLDNRLVGFPIDAANTGNNPTPSISALGGWQTFNMLDGAATDKRRTEMRELYASTQELYSTTRQHSVRDVRRVRKFVYDFVPGLHVYDSFDRASDADYVALSGLATKDNANAFEQVWNQAALLKDIIIIHDRGSDIPEDYADLIWELARLYLPEQRADFRACFSDLALGGELYRIDVDMLILDGTYAY
jgi:hypothetical protein